MKQRIILNSQEINKALERMTFEIIEQVQDIKELALIGIQRRGVDLASRIKTIIETRTGEKIRMGKLDINLYRDDWTNLTSAPVINSTEITFSITGRTLVLIDDVLFTGRTIRCALEALLDFGRPRSIKLLVLIDRGHRELPIHADFVGKKINTSLSERVDVLTLERDQKDEVLLLEGDPS
ncbi:bifunctional pyr operon transcriptional regulator/uracil phosphoribosyltransferase PyrR [Desulfonatronovibrio hydrogenovorans]|uniref:bifunctional pyr operon transcriptional regulator/uracil phosphoribosyltransferase PyrR n=1 Tax=Desulfonatronovibrio hydrogenovorans TaxID=53245 RepID=UPI0004921154|nr:bifunctional pyr operon transcriptional regulator/uracil phosphoribosyltransferase PyrR [Desulfonatronovibrio hydrogenovorans]